MVELPLINRAFAGLALALPGVQAGSDRFGTVSVSGGQGQQTSYLINGADDNDFALNTLVVSPNLDAIDQFNLIDGPLNAEYDRNSGGIISATIKQGSNHFHGNVFEFYRDTFLNTNNFFQKTFNAAGQVTNRPQPSTRISSVALSAARSSETSFSSSCLPGNPSGRSPNPHRTHRPGTLFLPNGDSRQVHRRPTELPRPFGQAYGTFSGNSIPSTISVPGCTTPLETWAQCAFDRKGIFRLTAFNSISSTLIKQYVPPANSGTNFVYNSTSVTSGNQYIGRLTMPSTPGISSRCVGLYQKTLRETVCPSLVQPSLASGMAAWIHPGTRLGGLARSTSQS